MINKYRQKTRINKGKVKKNNISLHQEFTLNPININDGVLKPSTHYWNHARLVGVT